MKLLLLGGTGEARRLADDLLPEHDVVSSLAGRTTDALLPAGQSRQGGFGGVSGLTSWLEQHQIQAVIDATHPFAATMTTHAVAACAAMDLPLLVLRRPGWQEQPGDNWHWAPDAAAAAALLPSVVARSTTAALSATATSALSATVAAPGRAFLTIGRQGLAAFAHTGLWTLARCVDPPEPVPTWCELLLDRGPYNLQSERALLQTHQIDVIVTKNSGGDMTAAKLTAARELGIPVVLIERPPLPAGVATARTTDEVRAWLNR